MNKRLIGIACLSALLALPAYAQVAESGGPVAMQEPVLDPDGHVIPYDGKKQVAETSAPTPRANKPAAKKSSKKKSSKKPPKKKSAAKTPSPRKTTQKARP